MRGSAQPRELPQNTDSFLILPPRGISSPTGDRALPLEGKAGPGAGEEKSGAQRGRERGGAERLGSAGEGGIERPRRGRGGRTEIPPVGGGPALGACGSLLIPWRSKKQRGEKTGASFYFVLNEVRPYGTARLRSLKPCNFSLYPTRIFIFLVFPSLRLR